MRTKIEEMGLDLYNALRGPLSQMETTEEMDNFKINEKIGGMNTDIIAECMRCAQINIKSAESIKRTGIQMDWEKINHYNNLIIEACKNRIKEENKMTKANAQVQVIEIEVNGIKYTQTRPGYYYKKTEDGQKRIPKTEWEQAFDEYTRVDEADEEWDTEAEVEARKDAEDAKDRETEENFNKKDEPKKAKKARRSKDVAFEMDTLAGHITLTAKQADFIHHIPDTCFYENGLDSTMWCDVLADEIGGQFAGKPMTVGAMISTLREKNLIYVQVDKVNGRKAKYFGFTELGRVVAQKLGLN